MPTIVVGSQENNSIVQRSVLKRNIRSQHSSLFQELRRCVTELGIRAVQIGSHVNEKNLDHADLLPVYKEAQDLDVCIFVHPWDMHNWDGRLQKYWLPWLVGKLRIGAHLCIWLAPPVNSNC